jgi:thiamine monophosphate kinase
MASPSLPGGQDTNSSLVRVIAYLTAEEAQELEMVWLQMRALAIRPSKADIMRAALKMALDNSDGLSAKLVELQGGGAPPAVSGRKTPAKV